MTTKRSTRLALWLILLLALALRLSFALTQDPLAPYQSRSSDSSWYLVNANALVTGRDAYLLLSEWDRYLPRYHFDAAALFAGRSPTPYPTDVSQLAPPPVYFLVIGIPQALLDPAAAVIAVRVLQAILSTATCYFAFALARRLTDRDSAGLLAALVLTVSPVFVIESAQILTETIFIFLITGGIWFYVEYLHNQNLDRFTNNPATNPNLQSTSPRSIETGVFAPLPEFGEGRRPKGAGVGFLVLAAVLLGLATLTRAVLLAFPLGLAIHLLMVRGWRKGWKQAALLLVVYALVVNTWTVYSLARWNRFVIAGEGLSSNLYIGATGWGSPQDVDQRLAEQSLSDDPAAAATNAITADPLGWIKRRVGELAGAYLQPHGTTFYSGESLRDLLVGALHGDKSLANVVQGDYFWQKLILYAFHYAALIGGLVGMWLYRRRWRVALPLIGVIAYFTLVHLALYALPRYLFPTELFWWVFAAAALVRLSDRFRPRSAIALT